MSGHIVLLGDSIFDNASYVPSGSAVLEHLRGMLPSGWQATLAAVDGAVVSSVYRQLDRIPRDATHLMLSVGGNDALGVAGSLFASRTTNVYDAVEKLAAVGRAFAASYAELIDQLRSRKLPLTLCTIYDAVPGVGPAERAGLCVFNDAITRIAFAAHAGLIDLRIVCGEAEDYSPVSPIEPSARGGEKIARAILAAAESDGEYSRVIV